MTHLFTNPDFTNKSLLVINKTDLANEKVTNQVKSLKEAISDVVFVNKLDHAVTENFDLVALFVESSESLDTLVGPILQSLKPNGKLSLTVSGKVVNPSSYVKLLKLSGFVNIEESLNDDLLVVNSSKVNFSSKPISLKLPKKPVDLDALGQDFIAEDELLNAEDWKKPEVLLCGEPTEGKKKRACKNCTCGLAEEEASQQPVAKSSCGNCALGDAFRCSSCPYKGLPPFKPGERVLLNDIDDI